MQHIMQMANLYYKLKWMGKETVVAYISMWTEGLMKIAKKLWTYINDF